MKFLRQLIIFVLVSPILTCSVNAGVISSRDRQITLVNLERGWFQFDAAIQLFGQSFPNINLDTILLEDDQLNAAIMAMQTDLDIMALEYEQYRRYTQRNVLVELSQNEFIMESLEQWMPGACDLLKIDGKLYALPLANLSWAFVLDGPVYRASGLNWPKEESLGWSELADLAISAGIGGVGKPALFADALYYPWPLEQYLALQASVSENINFDTAIFRDTMDAYKRLVNSGAVIDRDSDGSGKNAIAYIQGWDISQFGDSERRNLPTLDEKNALVVMPYVLAINKYSSNIDLAMRLMECLASPESQDDISTITLGESVLKDVSGYRNNPNYSDEDFAYREMLFDNWILRRSYPELFLYCLNREVFLDFYNDKISIDQLIQILQGVIDMIQME